MSALTMDDVSRSGGLIEYGSKGKNIPHVVRDNGERVIGSFDVPKLCGGIIGSTSDASVVIATDVPGSVCKRCAAILARIMESVTPAPAVDETAVDAFVSELFAQEMGIDGKPWNPGDDPARRAPEEFPAPVAPAMDTVTPGDVDASTPGNTDRVTAALNAARERLASAPVADGTPVREITPQDAVAKRAAAVDAERERLAAQRAKRADAVAAHKVTRARRKLDAEAIRDAAAKHAMESAGVESGTAPLPVTGDMRAAVLAFYADGGSKSPEVVAVESAAERRGMASGTSGDVVKAAHEWARITDGKCAVVVPADAVDESLHGPAGVDADGNVTVTLSGRMHMDKVTAVASVVGVDMASGIIAVGKSAGALAPVPGSDVDGIDGVCPVCRTMVKLTNSGAVGTHRPDGSTPDAPQLSAREIPAVDVHGEATRDASKIREREAAGDDDTSRAQVAGSDRFGAPRSGVKGVRGSRNMGRLDGVAMVPRGESGYAGMRFDDGGSVDLDGKSVPSDGPLSEIDPVVGGAFGDRRQSEYDAMSKAQRRRYRAKVARNRAVWEAGRAKRAAERAERGMPRSDMRAARKAAAVGSSRQGHTHSHHLATRDTDVVVTPVGGAPRMGRDWTNGK